MVTNFISTLHEDPFDTASKVTYTPRNYYGQIQIDAWHCVLVKGQGKVPFDAQQHSLEDRRTAITISLSPLEEQEIQFTLTRNLIAESYEWKNILWPSLKALKLTNLREAQGRWAKMQQVGTGRIYRNAKGEEKEATTFKFLALYESKEACRAAYLAETGKSNGQEKTTSTMPSNESHSLQIAIPFIQMFAKLNHFDLEKTKAACRLQPAITKAIDVDSPEFAQIVADALMKGK